MATTASPASPVNTHEGVPPLRAGQGHSFLLRKLHSLSGIIPVGAFLVEHFVSNAFATRGPGAYAKQVELLSGFPFVFYLELFGIWLPILYHALYGFYIWFRGESNVTDYPWAGNWMFTLQRWTGAIAFCYIVWHTWHLRFSGVHILTHPDAAFGKVQLEFQHTWAIAFYAVGNLLRLLALRLRSVAVRRQVGHHHWGRGPAPVRLRLLRYRLAVHHGGSAYHALVFEYAAAAGWTRERRA